MIGAETLRIFSRVLLHEGNLVCGGFCPMVLECSFLLQRIKSSFVPLSFYGQDRNLKMAPVSNNIQSPKVDISQNLTFSHEPFAHITSSQK
jgi:hypothetical protein